MKLEQLRQELAGAEQSNDWMGLLGSVKILLPLTCSRSPEEAYLLYLRGKSLVGLERFKQARNALQLSLLSAPDQFHAHYLLGYCFAKDRLWMDALLCQSRSCGLNPVFSDAWYEQGRAALELGDASKAVKCLSRAIELNSDWIAAKLLHQSALVNSAFGEGVSAASGAISQALSRGLSSEWLACQWCEMAGAFLLAGKLAEARLLCEALMTLPLDVGAKALAFPRRFASALWVLIDLACLDQKRLEFESYPLLRSLIWMPACHAEVNLWHSIIEPSLRIVELRIRHCSSEFFVAPLLALRALPFAVQQEVDRLLQQLDHDAVNAGAVPSVLRDLRDDFWDIAQINSLRDCLNACQAHLRNFPRDGRVRRRLDSFLDSLSNIMLDRPNRLVAMPGHDGEALELRQKLLDSLIEAEEIFSGIDGQASIEPSAAGLKRFLLIANQDLPQCVLYRVEQKIWQLQRLGCETRLMWREDLGDWKFTHGLLWADAVIVCRMPALHSVLRLIYAAKRFGCIVFFDIDDLLFDEQYCPPSLSSYGGTLSPVLHRRFALDVPLFKSAIQACDALIVSTTVLARRWNEIVPANPGKVFVLPNMAPQALLSLMSPPADIQQHGVIRLAFASGTTAHKQVWRQELAPALLKLLIENPLLHLDLIGSIEVPEVLASVGSRIRCKPLTGYSSYLRNLRQADIGLVVLESGTYTDAKSAIRWMEFALLGIPSVVSPTAVYKEILQSGEDVLFARGASEWQLVVQRLIDDPALRQSIACNAHRKAQDLFGVHQADRHWNAIMGVHKSPRVKIKRRLLIVNVFFAPQSVGGATRVAQDQVEQILEIAGDRYDVTVLCADEHPWHGDEALGADFGLTVDCHAWKGARVVRLSLPGRPWPYHMDGDVKDFCRQWFQDECFDLIHAHCVQVLSAAPIKVARDMGIPYVVTLHDGWWLSPCMFLTASSGKPVNPADPLSHYEDLRLVEQAQIEADLRRRNDLFSLLESAAARLAVSEPFANLYMNAGVDDVEVLENDWTPMGCVDRKSRSSSEPLRLCFVGGMAHHKGYAVLQAAIYQARLSEYGAGARLTVVDSRLNAGADPYELDWNGTPVLFVPPVSMNEMADFYVQQDVLLAPSIWPESYGLVTREALSAGLWVVASEIGALAEPIRSGINGDVVPPGDSEVLSQVLRQRCTNHPQPRRLMRLDNTSRAIDKLLPIYDRLSS